MSLLQNDAVSSNFVAQSSSAVTSSSSNAIAGGQANLTDDTSVGSQSNIGVYLGWTGSPTYDASLSQYVATVGSAPAYVDVPVDYTQPMENWVANAQSCAAHLRASDASTATPIISLPMISSISNGETEIQNFNAIASGADDSVWLGIIQAYQAQGYTSVGVRIGWEMNGNWQPWQITDAADAAAFVAAFQHISTLVHDIAGMSVNVIWNPSTADSTAVPTEATYPGDQYVDTIGVDLYSTLYPLSLYDWSTHTVDATAAQWDANPVNLEHYWDYPDATVYNPTGTDNGWGLVDAMQFAVAHDKPFALPETGAGDSGGATGPVDNAVFPEYLASRLLAAGAPKIAFANLWDSGSTTFSDGSKPNEAAAWADFVKQMSQGDSGPSAAAGTTVVGHGQSVNLGSQVASLIIAGKAGDTETITAVTAALGTVKLGSNGAINYTAPTSGTDTLTYTVTDQLGNVATFTETIKVDSGPTSVGSSITVGHGMTVNVTDQLAAQIKPGLTGDVETITAITAHSGTVTLGAGGAVTYYAPPSGTDTLTYTVTDQVGDTATLTTAIVVDRGPQMANGSASVMAGTTTALGAAIAALIAPGIAGITEQITAVSAVRGTATLGANGAVSYVAPSTTGADKLTYTVVDQYGATATATYTVAVIPTPATVSGTVNRFSPTDPSWGSAQNGVTVALVNASGAVVATTVSNNGWYVFRSITPGGYQLQFTPPAGEVLKPGGAANVATGLSAAFTLTPGESYTAAQAGVVLAADVKGTVLLSGTELAGVKVGLVNAAGAVVTTTTSSTGAFSFAGLQAGSYQVQYSAPTGEVLQPGGPANVSTGLTAPITLAAGQTLALANETLTVPSATLNGTVDFANVGDAGVVVALLNTSGTVVATTTTSSTGAFSFTSMTPGSYQLRYTLPAGETLQAGGLANTATGVTSVVTLSAGQVMTLAAQTVLPGIGAIDGSIHHYGSADPVWGTSQSGVSVTLLNAAGTAIATTVADGATGWFTFRNVTAGTYQLHYTLPAGEILQAGGSANTTTGVSAPFVVTAGAPVWTPITGVISSSNTFALNGAGAVALRGDGNYTVTGNASRGSLTLGNGNQNITLTGGGNTINVGAGNSTITALGQGNIINVGPGISFITADNSTGNTFITNAAGQGLETISHFTSGDMLSLAHTLAGIDIASNFSNLGSYITATSSGGNTTLFADTTGHGAGTAFAQLNGVDTTVANLISNHSFSIN